MAPYPYPSDTRLKMPGDILQNESGYNSSTDDHFSDAPEDRNEEDEEAISNSSPPTTVDLDSDAAEPQPNSVSALTSKLPLQVPDKAASTETSLDSISIPGAFGSTDDEDVIASSPPKVEFSTADAERVRLAENATPTQLLGDGAGDVSPEIVVKWNEKRDIIIPKVRGERERIERLVQEQRPRSTSPVFARKTSITPTEPEEQDDKPKEKSGAVVGESTKAELSDTSTQDNSVNTDAGTPTTLNDDEIMLAPASPTLLVKSLQKDQESTIPPEPVEDTQLAFEASTDDVAIVEDDGFEGDDFDDFGDTVEANGDDFNDFDDFEGFQEGDADGSFDEPTPIPEPIPPPQVSIPQLPVPLPDFNDSNGIGDALTSAVEKMFPMEVSERRKPTSIEGRPFLTERSLSLWNQLVAPPPLQPPNWKISRIRRLFLVSLGIPLDLDEILPTETKQKKLVLPSVHLPRHPESDSRPSSRNSCRSGSQSRRKKTEDKNQIKSEALDIPGARMLCSTSVVAIRSFTVEELQEHVRKLEETTKAASEALTYWLAKRDSAIGDKETFETVIESLVGYAKKQRQNG
ncbi:hypothetical protein BDD12DRAFT_981739 [Trichophaea hybrida]|nr:hypothetical protein BDD12DRAFT_981739 [Trichophaea hybrida]